MPLSRAAGLGLGLCLLAACGTAAELERAEPTGAADLAFETVSAPERARELLLRALPSALGGVGLPDLSLVPAEDDLFPDPTQIRLNAGDDEALAAYAALPTAERRFDLYLYDPSDEYWTTPEILSEGQPVVFRCDFILHLAPTATGGTRVEVLEYLPRVWLGKRFDWLGHSGPGRYRDIRRVAPTYGDRQRVLEATTAVLEAEGP